MMTYRRPQTLGNMLKKHKAIAMNTEENRRETGKSKGCERCGLCGHYGKLQNMVENTDNIITNKGKKIKLRQKLTCNDYGIYSAQCVICKHIYIGQTINSFSKRWNGHRQSWEQQKINKNNNCKKTSRSGKSNHEDNKNNNTDDEPALISHYKQFHQQEFNQSLLLSDAFKVTFAEKPRKDRLDIAENFWISKTDAKINIKSTCLPRLK